MTIHIERLEEQLLQMLKNRAPQQEFCEAIIELATTARFEELRKVLLETVYEELQARCQQKPGEFVSGRRALEILLCR